MAPIPGWEPLTGFCDPLLKSTEQGACNFAAFIQLIKNGIHDLVIFSTLIVVVVLVYAGFTLLTSGGNQAKYKEATGMLWKVVIGYVWILSAWLIVYTITTALLKADFNFLLKS